MTSVRARSAALLLAGLLLSGPAHAQDPQPTAPQDDPAEQPKEDPSKKDDDDEKKDEDGKKPTKAERKKIRAELDAIAEQFRDEQTKALMKRVPEKGSVYLQLGEKKGTFKYKQAEGVLDGWFDKVVILKLALAEAKYKGFIGTYGITFRTTGDAQTHADKKLYVTIAKTKNGFALKQLRVE